MQKLIDPKVLLDSNHGLEVESLRVDLQGNLSKKNHPIGLGSNLSNKFITTDFSESQIEMVTSPKKTSYEAIQTLEQIKKFIYEKLDLEELLWHSSMPPKLEEEKIKIANFGNSKQGLYKTLYRKGLAKRYGKKMQTISGVHYNFSFGDNLLKQILDTKKFGSISDIYMQVARNYLRKLPFITYLSGNSCTFDTSLSNYKNNNLKKFQKSTVYAPYGTSLRMSEIGYTSLVQQSINVSLNSLNEYTNSLKKAVNTKYEPYTKIETHEQINSNLLQIENELYLPIRPKQITDENERIISSLEKKGILYIELRSIDIDTEEISGVNPSFLNFLHIVLLHSLFEKNELIEKNEWKEIFQNLSLVVWQGRDKNLNLYKNKKSYNFHNLGLKFMESLLPTAELLDKLNNNSFYSKLIIKYLAYWQNPDITPSGKMLRTILEQKIDFSNWTLESSSKYKRKTESEIKISNQFRNILKEETNINKG